MINILDITTYKPQRTDMFFFDNNAWIFIFCPLGEYDRRKQHLYSSFLSSILEAGASIYINSLILSEFCNRYLRFDFSVWKNENGLYKADYKHDYIPSDRYRETTDILSILIRKIMQLTTLVKVDDDFDSINIAHICDHLHAIDFNDSYYIEFCKKNSLMLVTNDRDFTKIPTTGLTIVS